MTSDAQLVVLEIRLTLVAGYSGICPEPELFVWLRAVSIGPRPGKVLVVQPIESIESAGERPRTFRAAEVRVSFERLSALASMFKALGFPGRVLEIEDTSDPEPIWWAHATLEVSLVGASGRLDFGAGPDGVRGRNAEALKDIFRALFECAGVRSGWADPLAGRSEAGA